MQIQITVDATKGLPHAAKVLRGYADAIDPRVLNVAADSDEVAHFDSNEDDTGMTTKATKSAKATPAKTTKKAAAKVEETEEEENFDLSADDMPEETVVKEETEVEEPAISINEIRTAFKNYALGKNKKKDGSREKAMKVLAKYGVKSIDALKATNYEAVMKAVA